MQDPVAAIFDLDGTLVDNMAFHGRAWLTMCERMGVKGVTAHDFERRFAGKKNEEILPKLLARPIDKDELNQLAEEKEGLYREMYAPHLAPVAGLLTYLDQLDARGIQLGVASAAPPKNRAFVLDGLQLRHRFSAIAGAEDVQRGKPAPDLFLESARRLGVDPRRCWAFEDAIAGVQSAVAAQMTVFGLATLTPADALTAAGATRVVKTFEELLHPGWGG